MMATNYRKSHWSSRWWWTVDRYLIAAIVFLMAIGGVLVTAASPPVAERLNLNPFHFVTRQQFFLVFSFVVMLAISLLSMQWIRRISLIGFAGSIIVLLLLPFFGMETKGSIRWINLFGISLQPSEFLKPFFAITTAWIFSLGQHERGLKPFPISFAIYAICAIMLIAQPDFGMTVTLTAIWGVQIFLAGLPLILVMILLILAVGGMVMAYLFLPHVTKRIDRFIDPSTGDNYQIEKSLEAIQNGGFFGRGPGEGDVKLSLPDSHTDFIFAVAAEEFGLILCLIIISLYGFILIKSVTRLWQERDLFVLIATAGLLTQFTIQALINMGVAVQMFPAKGMTLPFLSYGGSSALSMAICMGMILALTRKRIA